LGFSCWLSCPLTLPPLRPVPPPPAPSGSPTFTLTASSPAPGRFVFVPGSAVDEVDGRVLVEAAGPPGVLRTVSFAPGETDEGLDVLRPIVVEGVLLVIRHRARGQFREVVELRLEEARWVP